METQSRIQNLLSRVRLYRDWWKVIFPVNRVYNKFSKHFVTLRTGERFQIRDIFSSDLSIISEVFGQDVYRLGTLQLPPTPVILDVGAHIGAFSVAAHSHFKNARIIAFEPHPDNFVYLQRNAPFVQAVNAAITNTEGKAYLDSENRAASAYALGDRGLVVETKSLRPYIEREKRVDLLKVDIEGAERGVFEGLSPELLFKLDRIFMEVHRPEDFSWFNAHFKANGFKVEVNDGILFASKTDAQDLRL